ncbi:MAG: prenyltransferase/squalene oxidase repeat-containing protein [Candidatus Nanopelagicales bacterium]|nr:prenyltransferase/squalene oxidase repeat-containing protein [Candidatus Nanopelagicales bacterium]
MTDPRANAKAVEALNRRQDENGGEFWSRADGSIHAPIGFCTLLAMNVLGDLGLSARDPVAAGLAEFVFTYQNDDGSFRYTPQSTRLPCITGQALAGLGRLGFARDPRSDAAFDWLVSGQWNDGGWRCPTAKLGKSAASDASNPGTTLFALDALRFRPDLRRSDVTGPAVEALLSHWETRAPRGPCEFGIGTRFRRIEYPFVHYNLFYYVLVLSYYEAARADARFAAAYQGLSEHVDDRGRLIVANPHRSWRQHDFARANQPSWLVDELLGGIRARVEG